MARMSKLPRRPRDPNQLAKFIVDAATGETDHRSPDDGKDPIAVARGRAGGLKGGKARAKALTARQRQEQARQAVQARWKKA